MYCCQRHDTTLYDINWVNDAHNPLHMVSDDLIVKVLSVLDFNIVRNGFSSCGDDFD